MGLRIGAPVEMRGIQIGTVQDTWVEVSDDGLEFIIPVLMEIELSRIRGAETAEEGKSRLDELIDKGFRAQLVAQSLVTGQQSIQLDFHPDTPVDLKETDLPHAQIPTILSTFAEIESSLDDLVDKAGLLLAELTKIVSGDNQAHIAHTLANIEHITSELAANSGNFSASSKSIKNILQTIEADLPKLRQLIVTADGTLVSVNEILAENREGIAKAISSFDEVEKKIGTLADATTELIEENRRGIKDFANEGLYELSNLAIDAQGAVEQFRRVMEELERDPARFLLGKPGQVEVK